MAVTYGPIRVLDALNVATSGATFTLDFRFNEGGFFNFAGTLATGDTVICKVSPDGEMWVKPEGRTYTSTQFSDYIEGNWHAVRFNKIGTAGNARVVAVLPGYTTRITR